MKTDELEPSPATDCSVFWIAGKRVNKNLLPYAARLQMARIERIPKTRSGKLPSMKRDLTKAQFEYRAIKAGFTKLGFMGYWALPNPYSKLHISVYNAGGRHRDQLRYLMREAAKTAAKAEARKQNDLALPTASEKPPNT